MIESPYLQQEVAEQYNHDRYSGSFGDFLRHQEVSLFLDWSKECTGKVLDVGAGTGKLTLPLMAKGKYVVSVDRSQPMMDVAVRQSDAEGVKGSFLSCDAHDLCFSDRSFECVMSSRVLMHVQNWKRALSEWCRVSRNVLIIDFPRMGSFAAVETILRNRGGVLNPKIQPYRVFTLKSIRQELTRNGYHLTHVYKGYFLPIALHRRIKNPAFSRKLESVFRMLGMTYLFGSPVTIKAVYSEKSL